MSRKKIHLVCNAHLDPVWLWNWEDGLVEAISTFRIAADFCDRYPGFVFNHNEALLYHWVERHDPALFARIQGHVAAGRWHVAGGAWLQPDVNHPHGESHIRQYLMGLKYFWEKFGVRPTSAYNYDPFGHPEGFPQILRGCGMTSYAFCRPDYGSYDLPLGCFQWRDRSGTSVVARRSDDHYLTVCDVDAKLERWLEHFAAEPVTMVLWGAGNHGGGATRAEYEKLQRFIDAHPEMEILESTPERFFEEVQERNAPLPVVQGEIQGCFSGCYTSMSRVKRAHREAESLMACTERLCSLAWWIAGVEYPTGDLEVAWRDILFAEFHDVLPGSGVMQVERDALQLLAHAAENLRRTRLRILLELLSSERRAEASEVPIFVFNPHGFRAKHLVELEFSLGHHAVPEPRIELRSEGRKLACQRIKAENNNPDDWIVRLVVPLELGPWEVMRLDASAVPAGEKRRPVQARKLAKEDLRCEGRGFALELNRRTGLVDRLVLEGREVSLVGKNAFAPVLFEDLDHSWTAGDPHQMKDHRCWGLAPAWKAPSARFRLATAEEAAALSPLPSDKWAPGARPAARSLRLVEDGPLVKIFEAFYVCGPSAIVRHYVLAPGLSFFEIRDRVFMNHRDHMLKLEVPLGFEPLKSVNEAAYSAVEHAPEPDCADHPNQRWVAVVGEDGATLIVAGTGGFAHHLTRKALGLNVLRSPAYSSFNVAPANPWSDHRFLPRQDQGEHELRWLVSCAPGFDERAIAEYAEMLNIVPQVQVHYSPPGEDRCPLRGTAPALVASPANLRIVALKKAACEDALIVRLQEVGGRAVRGRLRVAGEKPVEVRVPRYGLKTLALTRGPRGFEAREVDLVEGL